MLPFNHFDPYEEIVYDENICSVCNACTYPVQIVLDEGSGFHGLEDKKTVIWYCPSCKKENKVFSKGKLN